MVITELRLVHTVPIIDSYLLVSSGNMTQLTRLVPESHTDEGSNTKEDVEDLMASVDWPLVMEKVARL